MPAAKARSHKLIHQSHGERRQIVEIVEIVERAALELSPEAFNQVFDDALAATTDKDALARLVWIAGMYLDSHPGTFQLPPELANEFLAASDYDQLLAGLKAIRHCGASTRKILEHYIAVMRREDWDEKFAALCQMHSFVNAMDVQVTAAIDATALADLRTALADSVNHAPDEQAREFAQRCCTLLLR